MNYEIPGMRWGVEQRLEFIEFRLLWEGGINRADIMRMFGVSVPQASKDLTLYQERAPGNVEYDKSAKRYVASAHFVPRFLQPDPDVYLSRLRGLAEGWTKSGESWIGHEPDSDVALTPHRAVDAVVLRSILNAVRDELSLEILYQSMNRQRPDPVWRRISPHAFGFDGFRWHARAYCHIESRFKDFLLPRILDVRLPEQAGTDRQKDVFWHEFVSVEIMPHPLLTDGQKMVVAKDYSMQNGKAVMSVRSCMLFYVLKRLGLLRDPEGEDPRTQHIILSNKESVYSALKRTGP